MSSPRRSMFVLAVAALFVAGAQAVGVGIFVDNSEGAFLQTAGPMTGGEACALLPGSGGVMSCVMDPAATSASAAALLHAAPVAHVDAAASSKIESLLTHDAASRPGAVLNVHLAGVPSDALFALDASAASAVAGDLPHSVRHMEDCDAAHAAVASLGCTEGTTAADLTADCAAAAGFAEDEELMGELAAAAGAELTAEGFTFSSLPGGDDAAFTLPRGGGAAGAGVEGGAEVEGLLRELACFLGNTRAAMKAVGEDKEEEGAGAGAGASVHRQRLFNARLEKSAGVRESFGAGSREAAAAARLTAGAAKAAVARAHEERGRKVVSLVTVPDARQVDDAVAAVAAVRRRRRALLQQADDNELSLTPSQKFRNMSVATVVAVLIFVVAACGLLAMLTMSFPSDSLLYPRDKND